MTTVRSKQSSSQVQTGTGTLYCVGLGPGDPELMTVKAAKILAGATIIAYFHKRGKRGNARTIVDGLIGAGVRELPMEYPITTEAPADSREYQTALMEFYNEQADDLSQILKNGQDVVVLCEGDPFFYGSFMHLFHRLQHHHKIQVIPGVTGMSGGWTNSGQPITYGDDVLCVLPGTLPEGDLVKHLTSSDAAVIMKLGRNLSKVRNALKTASLIDRAIYVERGTTDAEIITPLNEKIDDEAPYFSLIFVPGQGRQL